MDWLLEVRDLRHGYVGNTAGQEAVRGVSYSLKRGAIGCLLGPSGCGKTTVLRCIAGFETPSAGLILLKGAVVSSADINLPPERRQIGMVFQEHALFPHLTAAGNIAFGLAQAAPTQQRVQELAALCSITDLLQKYPHELSGGQQQRVALARALAPRPDLLLLDEPFSNLDTGQREHLAHELRAILKASGATAVLVTHDQNEAFAMADEIGVLREGRIEQWDSAYNLYHRPVNRFVADFVGQGVFLPARALNGRQLEIELGVLNANVPHGGGALEVLLRPDDVIHDDASSMQAEVVHKAFRGAEILYTLKLESGRKVLAMVPSHHNHAIGERIGIRLDVDHVVAFAPQG